ncbi:MAG: hypothetical protein WAU88_11965 [Candidatus Zixiibacteriota bacterium]
MKSRIIGTSAAICFTICLLAAADSTRRPHNFESRVLIDAYRSGDTLALGAFVNDWKQWSASCRPNEALLDDTLRALNEIAGRCLTDYVSGINYRNQLVPTSLSFAVVDSETYERAIHNSPYPHYQGDERVLDSIYPTVSSELVSVLYLDSVHLEAMNWLFAGKPSQDRGTNLGDWDQYKSIDSFLGGRIPTGVTPQAYVTYPETFVRLVVIDKSLRRALVILSCSRRTYFDEYKQIDSRWRQARRITYIRFS